MKRAVVAPLAFALYVTAYFAVLALPPSVRLFPEPSRPRGLAIFAHTRLTFVDGERLPDFHGIPRAIFAPVYALDRRYLRLGYWYVKPKEESVFAPAWRQSTSSSRSNTPQIATEAGPLL